MQIEIRTLPVGQMFFATSYFTIFHGLYCYYCGYFNVTWMYIAVDCYLTVTLMT